MTTYDPHPSYRPEIDGLRAVAVLAVVFFHFSGAMFDGAGIGGGMVGVDIFFVISGFLIGGILMREHGHTGRIALGRFYLRRIRRLAPAYFAMATVSLIAAWAILLPFEFREFGKALIASTTYLANVHFFRETGYFDIGVENKILLHNWSLAVEEQFYVFLPFLILALGFSKRLLRSALVVVFVLSLVACVWLTQTNQSATFYLFPFRAWEMLAGVLLAIWAEGRAAPAKSWPSWVGMALMLGGIIWVQPGMAFPGWQVILPVLGAVLVLAGGQNSNPVNKLLSSPIPVFFGRISYSLYLWHWPVLTLSLYWRGQYLSWFEVAFWLLVASVLSVLSWRFIEQPVRLSTRIKPRNLLHGWALISLALVGAGGVIYLKDGAPGRFAPHIRTHIDASADFLQDWSRCYTPENGPFTGVEVCPIGPQGAPQVLIWGDSHLRMLHAGLTLAADETSTPALIIWNAGCPPFFGVTKVENSTSAAEDAACSTANARIRTAMENGQVPPRLLLVGRWSYYAIGHGVGLDEGYAISFKAAQGRALGASTQQDIFAAAFSESLTFLAGAFEEVHVLRQAPEIPLYDSRIIAREVAHGRLNDLTDQVSISLDMALSRTRLGEAPLRLAEAAGLVTLLNTWPYFCDAQACSALADGNALYFDNNHITNSAGIRLRDVFYPILTGAVDAQ